MLFFALKGFLIEVERWKWVEKPKVLEAIDTFSTEMTFEKSLE